MDYNHLCLGYFNKINPDSAVCPFCGFEEKSYNEKAKKRSAFLL